MRRLLPRPRKEKLPAAVVRAELDELISSVQQGERQVIIVRDGQSVAALVSIDDLARYQRIEDWWQAPFEALERTGEAFKDVPAEELEREVAKALTEVRAERRAELEQQARAS